MKRVFISITLLFAFSSSLYAGDCGLNGKSVTELKELKDAGKRQWKRNKCLRTDFLKAGKDLGAFIDSIIAEKEKSGGSNAI